MKKLLLLFAIALSFIVTAQKNSWTPVADGTVKPRLSAQRLSFPKNFRLFQLDDAALRQTLSHVPERMSHQTSTAVISLPNAAGNLERFQMYEASNFAPELQAQFPQIRSYVGRGLDDKRAVLRMSVDAGGIQTMVFRTDRRNEFMEPYSENGHIYAVFNSERNKAQLPFTCSTQDVALAQDLHAQVQQAGRLSNSGELLTFRLALSCNGEYGTYFGGQTGALAAMNATMTRVNGVFEMDFAIHMNIIGNDLAVIYTNAATDPYTSMANWNGQLQNVLTSVIGEANYDIGHMFGKTGGGGNAGCIGCVCVDHQKGSGITSPADGIPQGDNFDIDYVAHEMGHQMGANHTFSFDVEGTGVNVEPGSGSTIMGYAGITAQDIAAHSDDYFVYNSIKQVQDNMVGKTCPVRTAIADIAPTVDAGTDYVIPKSTPFILTGSGSDSDTDAISFCWEENDSATTQTGNASQASATKTGGPNWRSYDPVSAPVRFCPPIERVVANSLVTTFGSIKSEAVSSVARDLNFVLTARDNHLGIGQTRSDAMKVTVSGTAGPFLVQSPNTAVSFDAGSNQTVTWAVAGTDSNGVDCAFVDIYLSTNGGLTYPNQLAAQVPNDGSETVTIPNLPGTANRIMVRGHNHLFYDISNVNFTIAAPSNSFALAAPQAQNASVCQGNQASYALVVSALAGFNENVTFSADGQPAGTTIDFSPATIAGEGSLTATVNNTAGATPGFYPITVTATSGDIVRTVQLYLQLYSSSFDAMLLTSPGDNATSVSVSPVLNWSANNNASQYFVEISTNADFTNTVQSATVDTMSYTATGLAEATTYYWRVTPQNASCAGSASSTFTFQTGQVACNNYESENVPVTISASGTDSVTSILDVADDNIISSISVTMDIQHTWVNDLSATLISPAGTSIPIFINPCASDDLQNIEATFADGAAPLSCTSATPAINGTFASSSPLSALIGESSAGTWTLQVDDAYDQDGGAILGWSLNICSTQALGVKQDQAMNLSLYPNPNNGAFHLQFDNAGGSDVKVSVHDILGRELLVKNFHDTGIFSEDLQLRNAAAGTYLVTVQSGLRKEVRKIIVR